MRPKMAMYWNPTKNTIEFEVGVAPESPSIPVRVGPGEAFEGPEAYQRCFARHGLVLGEPKVKTGRKPVSEPEPKPEPKLELEPVPLPEPKPVEVSSSSSDDTPKPKATKSKKTKKGDE